jgi:transcription-repair coupling factor (superfamily II helicase)
VLFYIFKERLKALQQAEELDSGCKIALKDLELRGAGNILGKEQSGNINKVGLNLYCQMLAEAIEKLRAK